MREMPFPHQQLTHRRTSAAQGLCFNITHLVERTSKLLVLCSVLFLSPQDTQERNTVPTQAWTGESVDRWMGGQQTGSAGYQMCLFSAAEHIDEGVQGCRCTVRLVHMDSFLN